MIKKCDFCERADFSHISYIVNDEGAFFIVTTEHVFPEYKQFNNCPVCGRSLKKSDSKPTINSEVKVDNEILTLDEIRKLGGYPIWLKGQTGIAFKDVRCVVLEKHPTNGFFLFFSDGINLKVSDYGVTYVAYRHEPIKEDPE